VLNRLRVLALRLPDDAEVVVRDRVVGLKADRLGEAGGPLLRFLAIE
jgi:hypothetical protein